MELLLPCLGHSLCCVPKRVLLSHLTLTFHVAPGVCTKVAYTQVSLPLVSGIFQVFELILLLRLIPGSFL